MRTILIATIALGVLTATGHAQSGEQRRGGGRGRDRNRDMSTVALVNISFKHVEFDSKSVQSGRSEYGIYLPKGCDDPANAERRYPWAIWLHGMSEDYRDFHFGGAKVLDELAGKPEFPEMILVAASSPRRSLYANGEQAGNIADLILKDLVAHVQSNFRVAESRNDRAIMGISLGGMAALRFALSDPERFGAVATHSAALFPENPEEMSDSHRQTFERFGDRSGWFELLGNPIDKEKYDLLNPIAIAHKLKDAKGLRIYFDAGTQDRYGFGPTNQKLSEVMKEVGIEHTFHLIDGGQHSWSGGTVQKALVDSLLFVSADFTKQAKKTPATSEPAAEKKPAGGE